MVLVPCIEGKEEEENRRRGKGSRFFFVGYLTTLSLARLYGFK
jgi:hypothetical protein